MLTKTTSNTQRFSSRSQNMPTSFIRDILKVAAQKEFISFAGGLPDPGLFPLSEIEKCTAHVLEQWGKELLQYGKSDGVYSLKEWICSYYYRAFGLIVAPSQVLITNGAQQALDLIGKVFINPGDVLMLENPSYLGAIQSFSAYEPSFMKVPILSDGIDLEALEQLLAQQRPKLLYLVPNFQNPTGITLSEVKRRRLASLADAYDFNIVEDDPYGQLRFEGDDLKPIRTYSRQSILCGSFSKIVAPGLRVGWVIAEEEIIQKLLIMKQATDLHTNNLSQYVIDHFVRHGGFDEHLLRIRSSYGEKCNSMYQAILNNLPSACQVEKPQGGMFLWVALPESLNADEVLKLCMAQRVLFVPGKYFFDGLLGQNTLRLNFTNSSFENIEKGICILGKAITTMLKPENFSGKFGRGPEL